jgi:hypothetical protein
VQSNNSPASRRSPIQCCGNVSGGARKLKRNKVTGGEDSTRSKRRNIRALTWATQRPTVLPTPGPGPGPGPGPDPDPAPVAVSVLLAGIQRGVRSSVKRSPLSSEPFCA